MIESFSPTKLWPEAIATTTYVTNCLQTKSLKYKTPLDTLSLHTNFISTHSLPPKIFGCIVYVHLSKQNCTKLEPRAVKCVFVGYGTHQKGYRCYDPLTNHMYTTMDCEFQEDSYYCHHLRCQGEYTKDDLSWLIGNTDHKEQGDNATETAFETIVLPLSQP